MAPVMFQCTDFATGSSWSWRDPDASLKIENERLRQENEKLKEMLAKKLVPPKWVDPWGMNRRYQSTVE